MYLTRTRDTERSMINATTRERRFKMRLHNKICVLIVVLKRVSTLGKDDKHSHGLLRKMDAEARINSRHTE